MDERGEHNEFRSLQEAAEQAAKALLAVSEAQAVEKEQASYVPDVAQKLQTQDMAQEPQTPKAAQELQTPDVAQELQTPDVAQEPQTQDMAQKPRIQTAETPEAQKPQIPTAETPEAQKAQKAPQSPQIENQGAKENADHTPLLEIKDIHSGYGRKEIVRGASFKIERGEFACIIGANGCGKTTALKTILGLLRATSGDVLISGKSTLDMSDKERAKHFAYIPQLHNPPFPFVVSDVVILGRTPYVNGISHVSEKDKLIAYRALKAMSIEHLASSTYTHLSGGQQQLVLIARALAQQPDVLIMDEPTASLDFGNQQLVLGQMRKLANEGMSVLMVTHDPDHALFCSTRTLIMEDGVITADGKPQEVITAENLERIYNSRIKVMDFAGDDGKPVRVCIPVV